MWIALTAQHIEESLSGPELQALKTLKLAEDQTDPIPEAIKRTTDQVCGYVAAYHGTSVGQPGTIPSELLTSAISIARWRVIGRLPVKAFATDARRKEYEDAVAELKDVAAGRFAISVADDPNAEQPRQPAEGRWGSAKKI